jgi:extracellular factor (EF) 3-hydroxypalmitic acid methyl ester biosynthesis protein
MDSNINSAAPDSFIVCRNSQGVEVRATSLRLTRFVATFEVYNPYSIIQLSEVLNEFKIIMDDRMVYSGRAVVSSIVNAGITVICEAALEESWLDVDMFTPANQREKLKQQFQEFVKEWRKVDIVTPEFKVVVADIETLLIDLRRWLEQVELGVRSQPAVDRLKLERDILMDLRDPVMPIVAPVFEKFEETCNRISGELRGVHGTYVKRQLHPLVSCAPFFFRCFRKPLGYAGDYEMVSMMLREPMEGGTMFAKLLNMFFLNTPPVVGHRNRIQYLRKQLCVETERVAAEGRKLRVFNLGCGPAREIQEFLIHDALSEEAEFTLLDFNDETLAYTKRTLEELKQRHGRLTSIKTIKKSVHQLLKDASRPRPKQDQESYDLVYCAGLFDYLSDRICRRLMNIFYDLVAPGGLLIATNVDSSNPSRNWMEYVVDWHLVYRDSTVLASLKPEKAAAGAYEIESEQLGVNIFIKVRKPKR